ncbi:DNA-binding transcriptional activator of the SARP family [Micromonospora viridifaciens]|uniref:DNA-binding transcriptional activator of the SARP family n=1 Tax=Micromonospora viridifaciens TaxID=1881 RepID=A0A1C4YIW5_MICVI|nr:DNA-binding transcriptional activator of the SARP family [Micromonospora viridifaciens]
MRGNDLSISQLRRDVTSQSRQRHAEGGCAGTSENSRGSSTLGLLGTLEVWGVRRRAAIGGPRHQSLLAALAARPGSVVATEQLIDDLWPEKPPASARQQVQNVVAEIRRALRLANVSGSPLISCFPGYLLCFRDDSVDSRRFEAEVAEARRSAGQRAYEDAVRRFRVADALWRGPAFQGIPGRAVRAEAKRLEEVRLDAAEERLDIELALGRHRELIAELSQLTILHPLRERAWGQLMLALYRAGRQAEALSAYARARRILADELGIDPCRELQELAGAILRGEVWTSARQSHCW